MALRIGVLTFHRCINYGSYWQARCLVEGLGALGHEAELLDHDSPRVNRAEWRCALEPLLPAHSPPQDRPLYAEKARKFLAAFEALPRSRRFRLETPGGLDRYDLIIVGSDEVWNLNHPWYGHQPVFWGEGLPARRVAAYAASFGNHDARSGLDGERAARLGRFDAISVRDHNSRLLVRSVLGAEPALVLDPCLQFPPLSASTTAARPYVAIYGHSFPDWFQRAIRRAREWGWRLVSIGYRNDWADEQRISAGPAEFVRLIAGSTAVATNFFHGCVFALLNGKPFASTASAYRSNKLRDLARMVGAEHRLVNEAQEDGAPGLLRAPLEEVIGRRLLALRQRSSRYLDHVLA